MLDLNEPQSEAVLHPAGPLLVFAGAGSGKTRVITYRIARLMAEDAVPPYRILAVTFTNKAAREMRTRLEALTGPDLAGDLWVGTFHSLSARLLRRYGQAIGLSSKFIIYDDADQKAVVTRALRAGHYDEKRYAPKLCLGKFSAKKRQGLLASEVTPSADFDDTLCRLFEAYEKALRKADAVDFDDLILLMVRLLEGTSPEVAAAAGELRARFDHVLVDEFQDTNALQYRWVRALSARTGNLCVVGDDDQSIYSWRGADVRNIRDFDRDFPAAKVVKLEQNYRCTGNIVAAARGVIGASQDRTDKALWTQAPGGEPVVIEALGSERDEARHVAESLKRAIAEGVAPRELAVFYRVNAQSRVLEEALRQANLPYQVVGGMRFFERAEVKNLIAYLRLMDNPLSDADLVRILNVPTRGLGERTLERLLAHAGRHGLSLLSAIGDVVDKELVGGAPKKKLKQFYETMQSLRQVATTQPPSAVAEAILEQTGYRATLKEQDNAEADARLENLAELVGSIEEFELESESEGRAPALEQYLERVALVSDIDRVRADSAVLLMTVHSAKGLEFDTVFLTGMEEETFPYRGLDSEHNEELEEERRLTYVALTRAKRRLHISYAATRTLFGQTRYLSPSRFLTDIPADAVEQRNHESAFDAARPSGWGNANGRTGGPAPRLAWSRRSPSAPRPGTQGSLTDAEFDQRERHRSTPPRLGGLSGGRGIDYAAFNDVPRAERESASVHTESPLQRGSRVFHKRFGAGVVEGLEANDKVVARFKTYGTKRVLGEYLSLSPPKEG